MKKNYIIPTTIVMQIETASMIAQSTLTLDSSDANSVTSEDDLLSRHSFSIWDDDEE